MSTSLQSELKTKGYVSHLYVGQLNCSQETIRMQIAPIQYILYVSTFNSNQKVVISKR